MQGAGPWVPEVTELAQQGIGLELLQGGQQGSQGLGFTGEDQPLWQLGPEQRFDPRGIAHHHQLALLGIPDGKGEHAIELGQAGGAAPLPEGEQHLSVAMAAEGHAAGG